MQDAIAELGQPVPIAVTAVTSHEQAQAQRFLGSPDDNEEEPEWVQVSYLRDALEATLNRRPVAVAEAPVRGCGIKWRAGRSPVEATG